MKTLSSMIRGAAACVALLATQSQAAELALPREGWTSWQVDAVEGAPEWCCWSSWDDRVATRETCKLDGERQGYGTRGKETTDSLRIYARLAGGKVERLRAMSARCPVEVSTPIHDLGRVAADDSTRWLVALTRQDGGSDLNGEGDKDVLPALAMQRGDLAQEALAAMARGDASTERRKHATFWLAMLRGVAGAEITTSVMFNDKDPDVRKHAAFAITESKSPRIAAELIRLGNTDKVGDVRAQAWFWLAHTGAAQAEAAIVSALRKDADDHVREQAIFALTQLPDARATRALIGLTEDRSLTGEQRKRAIFWLAQSDSAGAQAYLEKVLARTTAD